MSLMHKKGMGRDLMAIIIFLLVFGFMSILGYLLLTNYITAFETTGYYTGVVATTGQNYLNTLRMFDAVTVIMLAILIVALGISNYKISTNPVFFVVTLVLACFFGFISYFFNYVFIQLVSDEVFTSILIYFPMTMIICTNLHWVMLVSIIVGSVTLYAKKPKGQYVE